MIVHIEKEDQQLLIYILIQDHRMFQIELKLKKIKKLGKWPGKDLVYTKSFSGD